MSKKEALGDDPLSWIRGTNNAEKPEKEANDDTNDKEEETKLPIESKVDNVTETEAKEQEILIVQEVQEVQEVPEEPEEPEAQEVQEKKFFEASDVTEKYRKIIQEENASKTAPKEGPATIFVVVYTVLLIILGFLVYRDMSKKINNLETKLTNIEKKIESSYETIENTNRNETW